MMKLKCFLLSSIIVATLTACSDDQSSSTENAANSNNPSSASVAVSTDEVTDAGETSNIEATPDKVIQAFFDHVLNGNIEQAAELLYIPEDELDSPQYMKKVKQSLEEGHKELGPEGVNLMGIDIGELNYSASKKYATISVTMNTKDHESQTKDFDLVNTNHGWKVDISDSM